MASQSGFSSSASFYEEPYVYSAEGTRSAYAHMRMNLNETKKLTKKLENELGIIEKDFSKVAALMQAIRTKKLVSTTER